MEGIPSKAGPSMELTITKVESRIREGRTFRVLVSAFPAIRIVASAAHYTAPCEAMTRKVVR